MHTYVYNAFRHTCMYCVRAHNNAGYTHTHTHRSSVTKIGSSTDNLNDVDTPQLRSFRKNRLQGQTKDSIKQAAEERMSFAFIDLNKHQVSERALTFLAGAYICSQKLSNSCKSWCVCVCMPACVHVCLSV